MVGAKDDNLYGRQKSNSIQLLDDLAVQAQSRRRHCNLDTSMLPILEDPQPVLDDNRPSIFKTIVPARLSNLNSTMLDSPRTNLYNLKTSAIGPSLLSNNKSGNYTASTALDTHAGSERMTLRATLDDKKVFKQDLAIFCVDEHEEEKDFSIESSQSRKKAKSFEKSSSSDKDSKSSLQGFKARPSDLTHVSKAQFQASQSRDHFFQTDSRKLSNDSSKPSNALEPTKPEPNQITVKQAPAQIIVVEEPASREPSNQFSLFDEQKANLSAFLPTSSPQKSREFSVHNNVECNF